MTTRPLQVVLELRERWAHGLAYGTILGLALLNNSRVAIGQFAGDDEADQTIVATRIVAQLKQLPSPHAFADMARILSTQEHPPLRFVLSVPGVFLFPREEFGPRMVALLASLVMTYLVVQLGKEVGGHLVGYAAGILVGASAVYNWTSMAFAWSVIVVAIVQSLRLLRKASFDLSDRAERRRLLAINAWIALAFLTNTTAILFLVSTALVYGVHNTRKLRSLAVAFAPTAAFYSLYYLYFFAIVPAVTASAGQRRHSGFRLEQVGLHPGGVLEDIQGLNAYFFPGIGCALFALAFIYLARRERTLLVWLLPYLLVWSFVMIDPQQYFLLAFVAMVPFAIRLLFDGVGRRTGTVAVALAATALAVWSYALFVRSYPQTSFPYAILRSQVVQAERFHNLVQPYGPIAHDVVRLLERGGTYSHDVSGSLSEYYLNADLTRYEDARYLGRRLFELDPEFEPRRRCYRLGESPSSLQIAISERTFCPELVERIIRYRNSRIKLFVLKQFRGNPS